MKSYFFDGNAFAENGRNSLISKVKKLKRSKISPKLVSVVVGNDGGALFYQSLKKKKASEIGVGLEIKRFEVSAKASEIIQFIKKINTDNSVHGVMIQLPLPKKLKSHQEKIIQSISSKKDVDGLRPNGEFEMPVVLAVDSALNQALDLVKRKSLRIVVVGGRGFVGKRVIKYILKSHPQHIVDNVDKGDNLSKNLQTADVIISCAGIPGLIHEKMIKEGAVLIDVGAPKGDMKQNSYTKASFVSPVPGGVGPATIHFLLSNLIDSALTRN